MLFKKISIYITCFIMGFFVSFILFKSIYSQENFKNQVNNRKDFFPHYYALDIPGSGLWCSPLRARLTGAGVFLVLRSSKDNSKRLLMVVEKQFKQGLPVYRASIPAGFYNPEYKNPKYTVDVFTKAESDIYESHLMDMPLTVSEAYSSALYSLRNEQQNSYQPDTNLVETVFRETWEETGFDLNTLYLDNRIEDWKILHIKETLDSLSIFYYGEIQVDELPPLMPQDDEIKIAEWVDFDAISIETGVVTIQEKQYSLSSVASMENLELLKNILQ